MSSVDFSWGNDRVCDTCHRRATHWAFSANSEQMPRPTGYFCKQCVPANWNAQQLPKTGTAST